LGKDRGLTDEEKQLIATKYKGMSDRGIAKKLGITRESVRKHRQGFSTAKADIKKAAQPGRFQKIFTGKIVTLAAVVTFFVILIFAFNVRKYTFNLPHFRGDEHHYVGLAFKLDTQGFSGYNLRGIDMIYNKEHANLIQIAPAKDKGSLLKSLARDNITYYDEPLHHIPFAFPFAIMLSHKLFAPNEPFNLLLLRDESKIIMKYPPGVGLKHFRFDPTIVGKQFYSVIVPLMFSMLLIISVYFLAKYFYKDNLIALTAMFLMAVCPIDILTSQKLWADDMTAFLTVLAVILYVLALDKKMPIFALLGGLSCGLSAITKQNGAFVAFAIVIWHFGSNADKLFKKDTFLKVIFDKYLILFIIGAVVSSGYWFLKVTSVYGSPIYKPYQAGLSRVAKTGWFKAVGSRPRYLYLLGIPYQNPIFGLAYLFPLWLWKDKKLFKHSLFLVIWIAVFLYIFTVYLGGGGKEHRYMLPVYPAFAILGAYVANKIRLIIDKAMGFKAGSVLLAFALAVSAAWSIPIGLGALLHGAALIMRPF